MAMWSWLVVLCAALAAPEPVGTLGATVQLPDDWQRMPQPDLNDQFSAPGAKVMMAVVEQRQLLLTEADFRAAFAPVQQNLQLNLEAEVVEPPSFRWLPDGRGQIQASFRAKVNGIALYYVTSITGQDTLGHLMLVWGMPQNRAEVDRLAPRLHRSLLMPDSGSDWATSRQPTVDRMHFGEVTVSVASRRSLVEPRERMGDATLGMKSPHGRLLVIFVPHEQTSAHDALEASLEVFDSRGTTVVERGERTVAGFVMPWLRYETTADGGGFLGSIQLDDRSGFDFRFVVAGPWGEAYQHEVELLLDSLVIDVPVPLLDFPEPEPGPSRWNQPTESELALVEASTVLRRLPGSSGDLRFAARGLVRIDAGEVALVPLDGSAVETVRTGIDGHQATVGPMARSTRGTTATPGRGPRRGSPRCSTRVPPRSRCPPRGRRGSCGAPCRAAWSATPTSPARRGRPSSAWARATEGPSSCRSSPSPTS